MPIQVTWDDEARTRLVMALEGRWSWDEFDTANRELAALMDTVPYIVDVIVDLRLGGYVPQGNTIVRLKSVFKAAHPRVGIRVFVQANKFVSALLTTFLRVYPQAAASFVYAPTMEAARAELDARRTVREGTEPAA